MKYLILINGPMGVGKTTVAKALKNELLESAHLDADWLWDINPFRASKEYKKLVYDNCTGVLNNFIAFPDLKYIIFSWVMTSSMKTNILDRLKTNDVKIFDIILDVDKDQLFNRWRQGNEEWRTDLHWQEVALNSINDFSEMKGVHINTNHKTISEIIDEIIARIK